MACGQSGSFASPRKQLGVHRCVMVLSTRGGDLANVLYSLLRGVHGMSGKIAKSLYLLPLFKFGSMMSLQSQKAIFSLVLYSLCYFFVSCRDKCQIMHLHLSQLNNKSVALTYAFTKKHVYNTLGSLLCLKADQGPRH